MIASMKKNRLLSLALLAAAAIVAALALSACGSGGDSATAAGPDAVTVNHESTEITSAAFPGGHDTDEVSVTGYKPTPPCELVSKKQAEKILGAGVTVAERPQGPTCVYSGSGREVDLVVSKTSIGALKKGARKVEPVTVSGHQGYCLKYQTTSFVVALGSGNVLQATGACQAGASFAAIALKRL